MFVYSLITMQNFYVDVQVFIFVLKSVQPYDWLTVMVILTPGCVYYVCHAKLTCTLTPASRLCLISAASSVLWV